jgi:pyruvate/2-oxoglutarate dehydrogenase complex dihydrolipoamide acyltransferase (E2) component
VARITFDLPDLGEGLIGAKVLEWLVSIGDFVERGAPLVEVETTKSAIELPSPQTGTVLEFHVDDEDDLLVGEPLVTFEVPDEVAGIVGTVPEAAEPKRRVRLSPPDD